MSTYGRLWQKVSDIRDVLKRTYPGVKANTLKEARKELADKPRAEALLVAWEHIEEEMDPLDSFTGE